MSFVIVVKQQNKNPTKTCKIQKTLQQKIQKTKVTKKIDLQCLALVRTQNFKYSNIDIIITQTKKQLVKRNYVSVIK